MKVLVQQAALQRATARVTSAVERRQTILILANVLLKAEGNRLSITATDLDIEIVETIPATIAQEGAITVNASTLAEIARNAPAGAELAIEWASAEDPRATVKFGRSRYQLPVLPAEDFPTRQALSDATELTLDAPALHQLLDHVHFAQCTEETRYYLNGAHLTVVAVQGEPMLRVVATDGHRMIVDQIPCEEGRGMPSVTIPRKAVNEMRRMLADMKEQITLQVAPLGIALITGTGRLITKALDGSYPDYQRVMPTEWDREIAIDRALFKEAIKRVSLISADKARTVKLVVEDEVLTLTVRNMEAGAASEEIEVQGDGPRFETGFNAKYLLDILDQTDADQMLLRVRNDGVSSGRLDPCPGTKGAEGLVNTIMPLRV
jgi:DNA polymerase III subunit beta